MTQSRTIYNPCTGSSCSHVEAQEINYGNTTSKKEVCIVDNSYNILGPLFVLFGMMVSDKYLADPNQKQGHFVKLSAFSYLAYDAAYNIFIPKTEDLPNPEAVLTYTEICEITLSKNAQNNFTSINNTFSTFRQHCEDDYHFSPYPPPAIQCWELHTGACYLHDTFC